MKILKKILITIICLGLLIPSNISYAHSGRTDSSGGHHDYNNVSGLGSYHYHCGGNPPHLHTDGICPYSTAKKTKKASSNYYSTSVVKKVQNKLNNLGYSCGKADGSYGRKTIKAIKNFQKSKSITVNGKINKTLLKKLKIKL